MKFISRIRLFGPGRLGIRGLPRCLVCAVFSVTLPIPAFSQQPPCPSTRDYKYLRYDEEYRYLRNPACRTDLFDPLKFIPLSSRGDWYISLGAEVRETVEYFRNPTWGQQPEGPAYFLQRYMFHTDLHMGERVRLFVQFKSGLEENRTGGPRIIDEDRFDLNQAFLDLELFRAPHVSLTLRVGRQELAFGATRFVSVREGPNVHQTFDGMRFILDAGAWRVDGFASKPVQTKPGALDDFPDPGRSLWGVYATRPLPALYRGNFDLYYFGFQRKQARFTQGTAEETRHSLGARLSGKKGGWNYDYEWMLQWGSFGHGGVRAWTVESETGYTFQSASIGPRVGLKADVASGDRDPASPDLQTFNPLFPRGLYTQLVDLNGHVNFIDLDPLVVFQVTEQLSLTADWDFFWRQSAHDGLYGVGGNPLRPGTMSLARYIGSQPSVVLEWRPRRHITLVAVYTHFFPGRFLEETGPAHPVNYVTSWFSFKF